MPPPTREQLDRLRNLTNRLNTLQAYAQRHSDAQPRAVQLALSAQRRDIFNKYAKHGSASRLALNVSQFLKGEYDTRIVFKTRDEMTEEELRICRSGTGNGKADGENAKDPKDGKAKVKKVLEFYPHEEVKKMVDDQIRKEWLARQGCMEELEMLRRLEEDEYEDSDDEEGFRIDGLASADQDVDMADISWHGSDAECSTIGGGGGGGSRQTSATFSQGSNTRRTRHGRASNGSRSSGTCDTESRKSSFGSSNVSAAGSATSVDNVCAGLSLEAFNQFSSYKQYGLGDNPVLDARNDCDGSQKSVYDQPYQHLLAAAEANTEPFDRDQVRARRLSPYEAAIARHYPRLATHSTSPSTVLSLLPTLPQTLLQVKLSWPDSKLNFPPGYLKHMNNIVALQSTWATTLLQFYTSKYPAHLYPEALPLFRLGVTQLVKSQIDSLFETSEQNSLNIHPTARNFLRDAYERHPSIIDAEIRLISRLSGVSQGTVEAYWSDMTLKRKGWNALRVWVRAREIGIGRACKDREQKREDKLVKKERRRAVCAAFRDLQAARREIMFQEDAMFWQY